MAFLHYQTREPAQRETPPYGRVGSMARPVWFKRIFDHTTPARDRRTTHKPEYTSSVESCLRWIRNGLIHARGNLGVHAEEDVMSTSHISPSSSLVSMVRFGRRTGTWLSIETPGVVHSRPNASIQSSRRSRSTATTARHSRGYHLDDRSTYRAYSADW